MSLPPDSGLSTGTPKMRVEWRAAYSDADRRELISLRTRIYRGAGKHQDESLMLDPFDQKAQLVGVYVNGAPVASARVLCLGADEEWEHDRFVSWSGSLPPRAECAEISRFCVLVRHRNWRVMQALCHAVAHAMLQTRRRYIVACCTDQLIHFYRTFFIAEFPGISFAHSDLGPDTHHLFYCDYRDGMLGRTLKFLPWLSLWPRPALAGLLNGHLAQEAGVFCRFGLFCKLLLALPFSPLMNLAVRRIRREARQ